MARDHRPAEGSKLIHAPAGMSNSGIGSIAWTSVGPIIRGSSLGVVGILRQPITHVSRICHLAAVLALAAACGSGPTTSGRWVNGEMTVTLVEGQDGTISGVGTWRAGRAVRVSGVRAGAHVSLHMTVVGAGVAATVDGTIDGDVIEPDEGLPLRRIR